MVFNNKKDHSQEPNSNEGKEKLPSNQAEEKRMAEKIQENMVSLKESEYHKLLEEVADYKDKYLRLFAEFDNARKRGERERLEFIKFANQGLLTEFLDILDDLERSNQAAKAKHEDYSAFLKGIEMVMAHIYEMLKKNNVQPMAAVGKKFDPHCHEALMQEETTHGEDETVTDEFQKGYLLGDRVLRTAKVKVAKRKTPDQDLENRENKENSEVHKEEKNN